METIHGPTEYRRSITGPCASRKISMGSVDNIIGKILLDCYNMFNAALVLNMYMWFRLMYIFISKTTIYYLVDLIPSTAAFKNIFPQIP